MFWGSFTLGSLYFLNYYSGQSRSRIFSDFFIFLAVLSVIYFPGISGHYIFHDDVNFWAWQKTIWATHPQYGQQGLCGRPLASFVMFSVGSLVGNVDSANIARFLSIVFISLIAIAIDIWLRRVCGISKKASLLICVAIVVLPPFQIYVNWICSCHIPVAALLSLYSAFLLLKPDTDQSRLLNFWSLKEMTKKIPITVFFSLFFLLCSLMIYQAAATFFIALLAIWLIRLDCRAMNRWPWLHLAVFFTTVSIYAVFFKILVPAHAMGDNSIYNNSFTCNLVGKLSWFFQEPMVAALNLWHIFPSRAIAYAVLLIILGGMVLEFFDIMKSENKNRSIYVRNLLLKYGAILFLIFLSFGVNLAVQTNLFFYRTIAPLSIIVFILFWSGLRRIIFVFIKLERAEAFATIVLFFICVGAVFSAYSTFKKYCVDNNSQELRQIENQLAQKYSFNISHIYIIKPLVLPPTSQVVIRDEFGYTTCSFPQDIPWLLKIAFQEKGIPLDRSIALTIGTIKGFFRQDPHLLIIDLGK